MRNVISVFCLLVGLSLGFSQQTTSPLALLVGNWAGELKYLNSRDNKSFITLHTKATSTIDADTLKMSFEYVEPTGKIVTSSDWFCLSSDGATLSWDGYQNAFEVSSFHRSDSSLTLIAKADGQDNNKNATIRKTILLRGKILTLTKQVKYNRSRKVITRNTYSFTKE